MPLHYIDLTLQLIFCSEERCKTPFQADGHCIAARCNYVDVIFHFKNRQSLKRVSMMAIDIPKMKVSLSISIIFKPRYNKTSYFIRRDLYFSKKRHETSSH